MPLRRKASYGADFMIASIHSDNTLGKISPGMNEWKRLPGLDAYVAERMRLPS
jgi:hypothetical protein